jgi:hypothetical protein
MSAITLPSPADGSRVATVRSVPRVVVRRRAALLFLVLVVALATLVLAGSDAGAELADPVAGHVVVAPGETLWDVAVATAPPGVDAREQVRAIQELNGLDGAGLAAWTVVLLPAR